MAEKKNQKEQDKNKILIVIIVLVIAAIILFFMSLSRSQVNNQVKDNSNTGNITQTPQTDEDALTSQQWTWVNTQMNDGSENLPSREGAFTLTFQEDERVLVATDCNNGKGNYELGSDNLITFGPMTTTMMFCEGSAETQFYQDLNNVGSYKIDNGQLWLMIKFDSGTMIFE